MEKIETENKIENYIQDVVFHTNYNMNNQDYHKTINDYISNKWPDLQDSDITSLQAR